MSRWIQRAFPHVVFAAAAAAQTCPGGPCFTDRVFSGEVDLGSLRGGPAVIDFDSDGWMDLYIAGRSNGTHRLYHNIADVSRPGERTFADVTSGSGLDAGDGPSRIGRGAVVADYDNDGDQDLYVLGWLADDTSAGLLYRNEGGGVFTDVSIASGVRTTGDEPEAAAWLDFDLDGDADLLVASTGESTRALNLFRNQGDGTFTLANDRLPALGVPGHCYSMTVTDLDLDGWSDVVLLTTGIGPTLLSNSPDGAGGRMFDEIAGDAGFTFLGPAPMGISAGDYDNDGDFDLAISNGAEGVYYENLGGSLARVFPVTGYWAWGVSWLDADNDGGLDLFHAGSLGSGPNHNLLYRNLGGGAFEDVSEALNDAAQDSKNAVRIDFDNDGLLDLVVINPAGDDTRTNLFDNVSTDAGAWVAIDLVGDGRLVNTDGLGAVVRVHAGGVTRHREVVSGSSTSSTEDLRAHVGLGTAAAIDWVEVVWPRMGSLESRTERLEGPIGVDQILTIHSGCLADFDRDGVANTRDVLAFLNAWNAGDPRADLNGDGSNDTRDVLLFLNEWVLGCG